MNASHRSIRLQLDLFMLRDRHSVHELLPISIIRGKEKIFELKSKL
jgi:hypothetical protein